MTIEAGTGRGRYLVGVAPATGADPVDLREVAAALAAEPDVDIVDVHGAAETPTLLVAEMTATRADELRRRHGGGLLVEPDAELERELVLHRHPTPRQPRS